MNRYCPALRKSNMSRQQKLAPRDPHCTLIRSGHNSAFVAFHLFACRLFARVLSPHNVCRYLPPLSRLFFLSMIPFTQPCLSQVPISSTKRFSRNQKIFINCRWNGATDFLILLNGKPSGKLSAARAHNSQGELSGSHRLDRVVFSWRRPVIAAHAAHASRDVPVSQSRFVKTVKCPS